MKPNKDQPNKQWEEFEKTNPRTVLSEGYLYFKGEDIEYFLKNLNKLKNEK